MPAHVANGDPHDDGWIPWKTAKDKGNLYRHSASRLNRIFKGMFD